MLACNFQKKKKKKENKATTEHTDQKRQISVCLVLAPNPTPGRAPNPRPTGKPHGTCCRGERFGTGPRLFKLYYSINIIYKMVKNQNVFPS